MSPSLRGCLIILAFVALAGLGLGQAGTKTDPKDVKPTETPKKTPLEKMKLPAGSIFVVVEDLKDAILSPKMFYMSLEKYQELVDKIAAFEKQLKGDKKTPHSCRLTGRAEADHVAFDVEFTFSTEKPHTTVILGLQGAHLTKEGSLDGQIPHLDFGDDGFVVQVEQPGDHQLRLSMELPVGLRRSGPPAASPDRGFDLGLPGAAVTTFSLDLPQDVKDLRWNDNLEKRRRSGRWEFALPARTKTVSVVWKEPITSGGGPLLSADGQVVVVLDEAQTLVTADLFLEPLRGQTSEWQLLLPAQAKVEVKSAGGLPPEVLPIDKKGLLHLLKLKEPSSERIHVVAEMRYPRGAGPAKLPIGPFAVPGAHQQQGTILIKATPDALRGTRLVYHRHGDITQRELPKTPSGADSTVTLFHYGSLPGVGKPGPAGKGPRGVALELELKPEKGQVQTQVEHLLRLRKIAEGYQVEATTRIKASALYGPVDFLDVQLPRLPTEPLIALTGVAPAAYPATLAWGPLFLARQLPLAAAVPLDYACEGEGGPELQPPDAFRRARIKLTSLKSKDFSIVLIGKYVLPPAPQKARLELPRPLGIVDRGGKVTLTTAAGDYLELVGDVGDAVPERHQHTIVSDQAPRFVNLAWRPYTPELVVSGETDVEIKNGFARVRHQVTLPPPPEASGPRPPRRLVVFRFPPTLQGFKVDGHPPDEKGVARVWASAREKDTLLVEYDLALPMANKADADGAAVFEVPLIWPEHATRVDAKVRFWCEPGTVAALVKPALVQQVWKNLGPEIVPQRDRLPALVLSGSGSNLPLQVRLQQPSPVRQVDLFLDRGMIQVAVEEEGHRYRARFLVRRFNTRDVHIDLPAPAQTAIRKVLLDGKALPYRAEGNTLHLQVEPELYSEPVFLELEYHLPASETQALWQTQFSPPVFRGEVLVKRVGWQVSLPAGQTPLVTASNSVLAYRWAFRHGVFTPEATGGGDWVPAGASPSWAPTLTVWRDSLAPLRVFQLPWQAWFVICSGTLLVIGLAVSFAPLPRWGVWLVLLLVVAGALFVRAVAPALFPMLLYGCQPGLVVLLLVLLVQWTLHERYRRQLVFLPGFMRVQSGSSLTRGGSSGRQREPTTVDAPASGTRGEASPGGQGT